MRHRILLVEDDDRMREIVSDYFNAKGIDVAEVKNGVEALDILDYESFDAVLLDIMMPGIDGYSVCKKIRKDNEVAIIFLTAKSDETDKLTGYEMGADDYITKPFSLPVLYAKVVALIKRAYGNIINDQLNVCGITIDNKNRKVLIDDNEVYLAPKDYDLLVFLAKNKNRVLTREQILNRVWGNNFFVSDRAVDTHIKKLRAALGKKADCIHTVFKAGYMLKEEE